MLNKWVSGLVESMLPFQVIASHTVVPRFLPDDAVILDFGANRGAFSRAIVEGTHRRCYAFEANPHLVDQLRRDDRFRVTHAALAGTARPVSFAIAEDSECSSILQASVDRKVETVELQAIDFATAAADAGASRIDLLKMDIEGAEIEVFDGMTDDELSAIAQLTIEFHDSFGMYPKSETRRIARRLRRLGFVRVCIWYGHTRDVAFLNRRLCPGAWWIATRTAVFARFLVFLHQYLHWRLEPHGVC